jgi:hypothetical protein
MQALTDRRKTGPLAMALAAALTASVPASEALGCGYDDPQSVSRGVLNWVYPDSLHVIGAISREVAARRLPPASFDQPGPDLFGHRFRQTKSALEQFGEMLRAASPRPPQTSISLVLLEPVLWTRFEPGADGLHARIHVSGAELGDLVLVSGEAVVGEIVGGRLTIGEAGERGLIRLYGSGQQKAEFIGTYALVGSEPLPDPGTTHARRSASDQPHEAIAAHTDTLFTAGVAEGLMSVPADAGSEPACGPGHH